MRDPEDRELLSSQLFSGLVEEIEIRQIHLPKFPVRNTLGSIDSLALSISEQGLLSPIIVRPVFNHFELVAGMRRLFSCKKLGMRKILANIVDLTDKEAFEVSLSENIQRETINPIEEAGAFKAYTSECGYGGISELARRIGKSEQYVSSRLQLLNLPKEIQEKVTSRLVSPSHAAEMVGLTSEEQALVSELIASEGLSAKQTRKITSNLKRDRTDAELSPSPESWSGLELLATKRIKRLAKCIMLFKVTLINMDEIIDGVDKHDWVLKEILFEQKQKLDDQLDSLINLQKKRSTGTSWPSDRAWSQIGQRMAEM